MFPKGVLLFYMQFNLPEATIVGNLIDIFFNSLNG
jgi:hypothetical protein